MPIKTRLGSRIGLIHFLLANLFGTTKCGLWYPWVDNEDNHLDSLQLNSCMHVEPKNRLTFLAISNQKKCTSKKIFEGERLIRRELLNLLQIVFRIMVDSKVIFKTIVSPDDTWHVEFQV